VTGAVTATGAELSARFAAKVVCTLGCHFWVGAIADDGYGRIVVGGGRVVRAHRWAWVQAYWPVPDGLMVMHGCDETSCVNAVECLLLGDQAGTWSRWTNAPGRPAGRDGGARIDAGPRVGPARFGRRCAAGTTRPVGGPGRGG